MNNRTPRIKIDVEGELIAATYVGKSKLDKGFKFLRGIKKIQKEAHKNGQKNTGLTVKVSLV